MDWWWLEGIDEGIGTNLNVSYPELTSDILYRYTYLLSRVMFLMIWFMHYMHFSTSVTWHSNVLDTQSLAARQDALDRFHWYQEIFNMCGICSSFNLPRQHSLTHFIQMIQAFGAPNGLCSSITKSKHIKAVKKPYRRSSHYEALGQMLLTNQHLDKLAAARVDFQRHRMLNGTCLSHTLWLVYQLSEFDLYFNMYHSN